MRVKGYGIYEEKREKFNPIEVDGGKSRSKEGIICPKQELFSTGFHGLQGVQAGRARGSGLIEWLGMIRFPGETE